MIVDASTPAEQEMVHRLEVLEDLLSLINDTLVFQDRTVVGEIDVCGLRLQLSSDALSVSMAFAEGLQRGNGFYWTSFEIFCRYRSS